MESTAAFDGLACRDCGEPHDREAVPGRCAACGGVLGATYDLAAVPADFPSVGPGSMWRFADLLPFPAAAAVTAEEGGTPLVGCPTLAGELGVGQLLVKDEGRNTTGSVADRGLAVAVTAAIDAGAPAVALASAGNDGHAAAAYAARAGLDAHVFVPSRAGFVQKAMINVHGGDMTVVEGRLGDATAACEAALADHPDWRSLAPGVDPYRLEGRKTVLYEVVAALGGAPDAIVVPAGTGLGLAALGVAADELVALGAIEGRPRLYAVQAAGCAPIVEAVEAGGPVEAWDRPDTICADVEVADPPLGEPAVEAVVASGGEAVAPEDPDSLESAVAAAEHEGLALSPAGGAAAAGAWTLAESGALGADETAVLLNPAAGAKAADVLRSHLMGQGV